MNRLPPSLRKQAVMQLQNNRFDLMDDVKRVIREAVQECEDNHIRDWSTIKSTVKDTLRDYIFSKTKRNPMILPVIMEV